MDRLLVVPRRTSYTPDGAWVGGPDMFSEHDLDIEISCVFTHDINKCEEIKTEWNEWGCHAICGGPAYDDPGGDFVPGKYIAIGHIMTSRGCPKKCPWCYVPKREGDLRCLPITSGNIIGDNNILATPRKHFEKVIEMLKMWRGVSFRGGLDADFWEDYHIDAIRGLRIHDVWTAWDTFAKKSCPQFINKLSNVFGRNKTRAYVLIGFNDESMQDSYARLCECWNCGAIPFAQIWDGMKNPTREWKRMARTFQRPAATKAHMKHPVFGEWA